MDIIMVVGIGFIAGVMYQFIQMVPDNRHGMLAYYVTVKE